MHDKLIGLAFSTNECGICNFLFKKFVGLIFEKLIFAYSSFDIDGRIVIGILGESAAILYMMMWGYYLFLCLKVVCTIFGLVARNATELPVLLCYWQ